MSKINLLCDRIADKDVFKAVVFSIRMMRDGTEPYIANARAAKYYKASVRQVSFYTGQHSSRIRHGRDGRRAGWESAS